MDLNKKLKSINPLEKHPIRENKVISYDML